MKDSKFVVIIKMNVLAQKKEFIIYYLWIYLNIKFLTKQIFSQKNLFVQVV